MRPLSLVLFPFALVCHGQVDSTGTMAVADRTLVKEVSPAELAVMIKSSMVFVCDCNEAEVYAEAHVPGAKLVVYDEITADMLPADHTAPLVFYCYSPECPAGATAAHTAAELGYSNVYCMNAGIVGWQDAQLGTEP